MPFARPSMAFNFRAGAKTLNRPRVFSQSSRENLLNFGARWAQPNFPPPILRLAKVLQLTEWLTPTNHRDTHYINNPSKQSWSAIHERVSGWGAERKSWQYSGKGTQSDRRECTVNKAKVLCREYSKWQEKSWNCSFILPTALLTLWNCTIKADLRICIFLPKGWIYPISLL